MLTDFDALFEATLADMEQVAFSWNFSSGSVRWHSEAGAVLGVVAEDVPQNAQGLKHLINPQDLPNFMMALQDAATQLGDKPIRISEPFRLRLRDGSQRAMRLEGRMQADHLMGAPVFAGFIKRVNDNASASGEEGARGCSRQNIAEKIEHILLNRSRAVRNRGYFMALGLDRVGLLNAAYGASFVDSVLVDVEKRLKSFIDGKASVCRISGDIYGFLFEDLSHNQADALAAALLQTFTTTPILTIHGPVMVGLSIGGAAMASTSEKGSDIVARAEAAMAEAKKKGRGCFVVSNPLKLERESARKLLANGNTVHKALEEGRMRMAFQPVVDMNIGKTIFFESLIRMVDQNGQLIAAEHFVPALEELGMIRVLDIYSLHCAVRELEQFPEISLSVNVSNLSLTDAGWLRSAVSLLADKRDVASRLIVEITESSAMEDIDAAVRIVRTLKDMGCLIALDDFGAGQTSFRQLKMLAVDIVKIDKAYIRDIHEPVNQLFVKSLLELANGMGLRTVAEGAETKTEAEMLHLGGITNIQGYAFGFPSIERVWLPKTHDLRMQKQS